MFYSISIYSYFRHFEGANAIPTLAKNVGSLCIFYFPLTALSIYEYVKNISYDTYLTKCCLFFLMLSPIANCVIFGLKNKVSNIVFRPLINTNRILFINWHAYIVQKVLLNYEYLFQAVQTNFINYARKQIDKSEVNEEIRLRSPSKRRSPRGSIHGFAVKVKRPSLGNILSQVPYLQQHLSEANLVTVGRVFLFPKLKPVFANKTLRNFHNPSKLQH